MYNWVNKLLWLIKGKPMKTVSYRTICGCCGKLGHVVGDIIPTWDSKFAHEWVICEDCEIGEEVK